MSQRTQQTWTPAPISNTNDQAHSWNIAIRMHGGTRLELAFTAPTIPMPEAVVRENIDNVMSVKMRDSEFDAKRLKTLRDNHKKMKANLDALNEQLAALQREHDRLIAEPPEDLDQRLAENAAEQRRIEQERGRVAADMATVDAAQAGIKKTSVRDAASRSCKEVHLGFAAMRDELLARIAAKISDDLQKLAELHQAAANALEHNADGVAMRYLKAQEAA